MRLGRDFLKVLLCFCLMSGSWPAHAQDFREIAAAQRRQIEDLKSETGALRDMLAKIIADQASDRLINKLSNDPAAAKAEFAATKGNIDSAIKDVQSIPEGGLPEGLKSTIEACISNIGKAAKDFEAGAPAVAAEGCSLAEAKKISAKLREARDKAVNSWKTCSEIIDGVKQIGPVNLPFDPSGLSNKSIDRTKAEIERLKKLADSKKGPAKECISKIENDFREIQGAETAANALGSALSAASSLCFATGGNPYACAAIFAVAILLNLFNGKGGGGGGKGDGKVAENDGGLPGKGMGDCTANCMGGGNPEQSPSINSVASPYCPGDGCPKGVPTGQVQCGILSSTAIECVRSGASTPKVKVDAADAAAILLDTKAQKELSEAITSKDLSGMFFCLNKTSDAKFIKGIVLSSKTDKEKSYLIGIDYADGTRIRYPNSSITSPTKSQLEGGEACVFD